jgi:HemY protein
MRVSPREPESRMAVARAALAARDFQAARNAMKPLIAEGEDPTVRMCLIMADLEEAQYGGVGDVRAWLARASRAPRDAVWMADGVAAEAWAPASPVTGKLDAFVWQRPPERPGLSIPLHPIEEEKPDETPALTHANIESAKAEDNIPSTEPPIAVTAPAQSKIMVSVPITSVPKEPVLTSEGKTPPKPVIFPQPELPDDPGESETPEPALTRAPYPFGRLNSLG